MGAEVGEDTYTKLYRLPSGKTTKSRKRAMREWRKLAWEIEHWLPGWKLRQCDPGLWFEAPGYTELVSVPLEIAELIENLSAWADRSYK